MAKKNKKPAQPQQLSLKSYIIQNARKLELLECRELSSELDESMKQIAVIRQKKNGKFIVGLYLIDLFCLGLKDTFYFEADDLDEINERLYDNSFAGLKFKVIEANYAFNLIYGAIEFAEDLGLLPSADFKITEFLLDDVDNIEYLDIEFGKDGRPFFMPGPSDNVQKIRATLDKTIGEGNYDFFEHKEFDFDEDDEFYDDYLFSIYDNLDELEKLSRKEFEKKIDNKVKSIRDDARPPFLQFIYISLSIDTEFNTEEYNLEDQYKANPDKVINEIHHSLSKKLTNLVPQSDKYLVQISIENVIRFGVNYLLLDQFIAALEESFEQSGDGRMAFFTFMIIASEKRKAELVRVACDISEILFQEEDFFKLNDFQKNRVAIVLTDIMNAYVNDEEIDEEYEDVELESFLECEILIPPLRNEELKQTVIDLEDPEASLNDD